MKKHDSKYMIISIIFIIGNSFGYGSEIINKISIEDTINKTVIQHSSEHNSLLNFENYTVQEIKYYAPKSGLVYLAWYPENYPPEEAVRWNKETKFNNGLLYTPLSVKGDTFLIHLKVPQETILSYNFWITKNKFDYYQDYWDLHSSGKIKVSNAIPIYKEANYAVKKEKKSYGIIDKGWMILFLFIIFYLIAFWAEKNWIKHSKAFSRIERVIFIGISLAVFHALARSNIIGLNPIHFLHNLGIIPKTLKASYGDFLFVFFLVTIFVFLLSIVNNEKINKWIFSIFLVVAALSTIIAFTNITTVIFLGKPFTYQWLYYSDFLGSDEAKTAMQENVSVKTAVNLLAFCISMFLMAGVLNRIYRLFIVNKWIKITAFSVLGISILVVTFKTSGTKEDWTKGQAENAITAMIYSTITANSNFSFFSINIPQDIQPFEPAAGKTMETPLVNIKEHGVKNVLFIILESAGAVYFDAYGGNYNLSPNLNKYASQALIIDQMYAHAPSTNRSLVSILGSIYPQLSYKSITQEAPDLNHPTISSVLKSRGYRTSFFSSANLNFQNCREFLSYRDFDRVEDFSMINCSEEFKLDNEDYKEGNGIDDMCLTDCLAAWLDEDTTKNFFSLIWTVQGHYPYFFAGEEEDFGVSDYNFNRYLNAIKHNDELVGKVMQNLKVRGLDSSTLVVVVGDHGEAFGQHEQYGHGTALYEENLKVPLYFINSTLFHGERKNDIAGMKDLATTALSVIAVDIPGNWQGRNLINTESDESFYFAPWSDYLFGYRKGNMKFIFNETRNKVEVYDLKTDSGEKINLVENNLDKEIEYARNRIASWVQFQDKFINQVRGKNK